MQRRRKKYAVVRDPQTGKRALAHRLLAAQLLGRPLTSREIVHHRDGDSTNNAPDNLIVLPSQRYHAHLEFHLRRQQRGMPSLFPELLCGLKAQPSGGLFSAILAQPVQEPPLRSRQQKRKTQPMPPAPPLFSEEATLTLEVSSVTTDTSEGQWLGELMRLFQVQARRGNWTTSTPLLSFAPIQKEKLPHQGATDAP